MNKMICVFKSIIGCILFTLFFITIFSLVLANTNLNDNYIKPVLVGITFFSVSVNSFLALRKLKAKGLIYGLIIGMSYSLILVITSLILNSGISFSVYSYIQIFICLLSGILGGILGVNLK